MADVFISYKSERRPAAKHLASIIEAHGYSVWFDYDLVPGKNFGRRIEAELRQAKVTIVLWCTLSVQSEWVQEEADLAKSMNTFVPARIESCEPPLGFRRDDYVDIAGWDGDPSTRSLDRLIDRIEALVGREAAMSRRALVDLHTSWSTLGRPRLAQFALGQAREIAAEDRRLPSREASTTSGIAPAAAAMISQRRDDAANDWRQHELDICNDPGLLNAFADKWAALDPVWSYKARQKAVAVVAEGQRHKAELERIAREKATAELAARIANANSRDDLFAIWHRHPEQNNAITERLGKLGYVHVATGTKGHEQSFWLRPGDGKTEWFKDIDIGPEMVVVPAGDFTMGQADGDDDEKPPHKVTIKAPFAVGRFAVTFDEWDAALAEGGVNHKPESNWGRGRQPVINVSWEDAKAYCALLSTVTGKVYRLLSEAEWEYCCRAGTTTSYAFGATITKSQAQFSEDLPFSARQTVPVGSFPTNNWGLHDMHGNVWEWCEDNWHPNYQGAPADGSVWPGGDTWMRVVRGGSWYSDPQDRRSARRNWFQPDDRGNSLGFRVARTLSPLSP